MKQNKKNISIFKDCYGCSVCGGVCPVNIIKIKEIKGFLKPVIIEADKCIGCGICLKTCSFYNRKQVININSNNDIKYYSFYSQNKDILKTTTSGGAVYEILKIAAKKRNNIFGVKYDYNINRPIHFQTINETDLKLTKGSKYLQSKINHLIKTIDNCGEYTVVGTPCQISSLHNYLVLKNIRNKFLLIDFFCHGVPSSVLWDNYLHYFKKQYGEIKNIRFRNKDYGWHESIRIKILGTKGEVMAIPPKKDIFFSFFLGDRCLQKSCYDTCVFKQLNSCSDIRVGDLWGKEFLDNRTGVSGLVCFTERGNNLVNELESGPLTELDSEIILSGQMKKNATRALSYPIACLGLKYNLNLKHLNTLCTYIDKIKRIPSAIRERINTK